VIVTRAATRVSTAGAKKGSSEAFCLIQGPGVPGGRFETVTAKSTIVVVHGLCSADVTKGPDGGFTSVTLPVGSPCTLTVLEPGVPFLLNGEPITFVPGGSNAAGLNSCWYAFVNGRNTRICS
jgi:hypothetical protein